MANWKQALKRNSVIWFLPGILIIPGQGFDTFCHQAHIPESLSQRRTNDPSKGKGNILPEARSFSFNFPPIISLPSMYSSITREKGPAVHTCIERPSPTGVTHAHTHILKEAMQRRKRRKERKKARGIEKGSRYECRLLLATRLA